MQALNPSGLSTRPPRINNDSQEPIHPCYSVWSQVQMQQPTAHRALLGGAAGVRVGSASPGHPEASAKTGGFIPVPQMHHLSKIKKRSFQRAIARANKLGSTTYRGQRLVARTPVLPAIQRPQVGVAAAPPQQQRLGCVTWNCDGLTQEVLAQLTLAGHKARDPSGFSTRNALGI